MDLTRRRREIACDVLDHHSDLILAETHSLDALQVWRDRVSVSPLQRHQIIAKHGGTTHQLRVVELGRQLECYRVRLARFRGVANARQIQLDAPVDKPSRLATQRRESLEIRELPQAKRTMSRWNREQAGADGLVLGSYPRAVELLFTLIPVQLDHVREQVLCDLPRSTTFRRRQCREQPAHRRRRDILVSVPSNLGPLVARDEDCEGGDHDESSHSFFSTTEVPPTDPICSGLLGTTASDERSPTFVRR